MYILVILCRWLMFALFSESLTHNSVQSNQCRKWWSFWISFHVRSRTELLGCVRTLCSVSPAGHHTVTFGSGILWTAFNSPLVSFAPLHFTIRVFRTPSFHRQSLSHPFISPSVSFAPLDFTVSVFRTTSFHRQCLSHPFISPSVSFAPRHFTVSVFCTPSSHH